MNRALILTAIMSMGHTAQADSSTTDLAEANLRGHVKQVITKVYYARDGDTIRQPRRLTTYDVHGNEICDSSYEAGDWLLHYTNTYDKNGRIVEKQQLDDSIKRRDWRTTYTYDNNGRLTETNRYKAEGELMQRVVFTYDAAGRNTEQISYGGDGRQNGRTELTYSATGMLMQEVTYGDFISANKLRNRVTYDTQGNIATREDYDNETKWSKHMKFAYTNRDANGNYRTITATESRRDGNNTTTYISICEREITYY